MVKINKEDIQELGQQILLGGLITMVITVVFVLGLFQLSITQAVHIGIAFTLFTLAGVVWSNYFYPQHIPWTQRFGMGLLLSFLIIPPFILTLLHLGYSVHQRTIFIVCGTMLLTGIATYPIIVKIGSRRKSPDMTS